MIEYWIIFVTAWCLGTSFGVLFGVYVALKSIAQVDESRRNLDEIVSKADKANIWKGDKRAKAKNSKRLRD